MWTPKGVYEFCRVVMGDTNSALHFCMRLNDALQGILYRQPAGANTYLDDLLCYSKAVPNAVDAKAPTPEEIRSAALYMFANWCRSDAHPLLKEIHAKQPMEGILQRCNKLNVFLNPKKWEVMKTKMKCLRSVPLRVHTSGRDVEGPLLCPVPVAQRPIRSEVGHLCSVVRGTRCSRGSRSLTLLRHGDPLSPA